MNLGRRWYLVGWDRGREDWRTFRVDRLSRPAADRRAVHAARSLPAKDAAAYVEQSIAGGGSRYEARVTVHAPAEAARARGCRGSRARSSRSTRSAASTAPPTTTSSGWRSAIAMLGVDVDVHEPPELIAQLNALAAAFSARRGTPAESRAYVPAGSVVLGAPAPRRDVLDVGGDDRLGDEVTSFRAELVMRLPPWRSWWGRDGAILSGVGSWIPGQVRR